MTGSQSWEELLNSYFASYPRNNLTLQRIQLVSQVDMVIGKQNGGAERGWHWPPASLGEFCFQGQTNLGVVLESWRRKQEEKRSMWSSVHRKLGFDASQCGAGFLNQVLG